MILEHVTLREATPLDLPLIYSSWLKSYRKSEATRDFSNQVYFDGHRDVIARLLKRSIVILAVEKADPDQIYGWVCFERGNPIRTFHYVYVKHTYRGLGLGKLLMGEMMNEPVVYTHDCPFKGKLAEGSYFNPYKGMGAA
jgi:L-amino acid N-acyltransferase YncA